MNTSPNIETDVLYIKNMACNCCLLLIQEKLEELGLVVKDISLGKISVGYGETRVSREAISAMLNRYGLDLVHSREDKLVEQIKIAVIELIHQLNNVDSIVRKSDYLVEKLGLSYPYLSKVFSEHEHQTLEKYIIVQKIERIKHLIDSEEYALGEIAYMMDYSSVQYLSNQFKSVTGMTVTEYKSGDRTRKNPIDTL
ncbi:transcriptional regulator, AraC family [Chloroherpeton thalassium ATCC 35110]|uniref:Transcriptional regulator, AraC family n=1 Tax=Chloroherpeton thalassium (strain ATCC 35110 / GB-78) TaxID=517418 RepID=B3QUA0_CHLT3|nr:AraC family transcriptional regulator [Chloroherpeton thalassium]ACF14349.1 transcriptional regulator, AraC family [Chloroherpeton thalassium ATCC 35110]